VSGVHVLLVQLKYLIVRDRARVVEIERSLKQWSTQVKIWYP
jgi:hypothetical protein